jgi:hypothetical protein
LFDLGYIFGFNRAIVEVLTSVISINTLLAFEPMTHNIVELWEEGTAVFKVFNLSDIVPHETNDYL